MSTALLVMWLWMHGQAQVKTAIPYCNEASFQNQIPCKGWVAGCPECGPSGAKFRRHPWVAKRPYLCIDIREYEDGTVAVFGSHDPDACTDNDATLLWGQTTAPDPVDVPAVQGKVKQSDPHPRVKPIDAVGKKCPAGQYWEFGNYFYESGGAFRDEDGNLKFDGDRGAGMEIPIGTEHDYDYAICVGKAKSTDVWTCSDKSRVLLTSEDGAKHCIKFGVR